MVAQNPQLKLDLEHAEDILAVRFSGPLSKCSVHRFHGLVVLISFFSGKLDSSSNVFWIRQV
jgi:hypothetical protein